MKYIVKVETNSLDVYKKICEILGVINKISFRLLFIDFECINKI